MNTRIQWAVVLVVALTVQVHARDSVPHAPARLFEIGGGATEISYPYDVESVLNLAEASGAQRTQLVMVIGGGWEISERTMATIGLDATGDRLQDLTGWLQVNAYLISTGVRFYPMGSGVFLGIAPGISFMVVDSSVSGAITSDMGYGVIGKIGYDFNRDRSGFGLSVGISSMAVVIEGDSVASGSLWVTVAWQ